MNSHSRLASAWRREQWKKCKPFETVSVFSSSRCHLAEARCEYENYFIPISKSVTTGT